MKHGVVYFRGRRQTGCILSNIVSLLLQSADFVAASCRDRRTRSDQVRESRVHDCSQSSEMYSE